MSSANRRRAVRNVAARLLLGLGLTGVLVFVAAVTGSVRAAEQADVEDAAALVQALSDRNTAWVAGARLVKVGPKVIPLLIPKDPSEQPTFRTSWSGRMLILAKLGEPAIPGMVDYISKVMRRGLFTPFAQGLIDVMGDMGPVAFPALVETAQQAPQPYLRAQALEKIVNIEPERGFVSSDQSPWVSWQPEDRRDGEIRQALAPLLPRIQTMMHYDMAYWKPRSSTTPPRLAAYLLARWGPAPISAQGLEVLHNLASTTAIPFHENLSAAQLLHRLRAPSTRIRLLEIAARIERGDLGGFTGLTDGYFRTIAAGLSALGDSAGTGLLAAAFRNGTPDQRAAAIQLAARTGELALVQPLAELITDPTPTNWEVPPTGDGTVRRKRTVGEVALAALHRLTLETFDADPAAWNAWWKENRSVSRTELAEKWVADKRADLNTASTAELRQWIQMIAVPSDRHVLPLIEAYLGREDLEMSGEGISGGGTGPPGQYGPAVVTILLGLVQDGVAGSRELLVRCLTAKSSRIRSYGALALSSYDRRAAVTQLAAELDGADAWNAANWLLMLGDARGIPALIDQLEAHEPATRKIACRDLRHYTQEPLRCNPDTTTDPPEVIAQRWREWWSRNAPGFVVKEREARMDRGVPGVPAVDWLSRAPDGSLAPPLRAPIPPSVTVRIQPERGEPQSIGPIEVAPFVRGPLPRGEVERGSSGAMTTLSFSSDRGRSVLLVLEEKTAPGSHVHLTVFPVSKPDPISFVRALLSRRPQRDVNMPCIALTPFFLDGVGDRRTEPLALWTSQAREAIIAIDPPRLTLTLMPFLAFSTREIQALSNRPARFSLVMSATPGFDEKTGPHDDFLVLALERRSDDTHRGYVFRASQRRWGVGGLVAGEQEDSVWQFYALEDRKELHSRCRG